MTSSVIDKYGYSVDTLKSELEKRHVKTFIVQLPEPKDSINKVKELIRNFGPQHESNDQNALIKKLTWFLELASDPSKILQIQDFDALKHLVKDLIPCQ